MLLRLLDSSVYVTVPEPMGLVPGIWSASVAITLPNSTCEKVGSIVEKVNGFSVHTGRSSLTSVTVTVTMAVVWRESYGA